MAKILITRLSSFGDVAMLVPVVYSIAARYPQDRFVVLTRKAFAPLFENLGFNIGAKTFDTKKHKGLGFFKLLESISIYGYTDVADMHDVLRTKAIRAWMFLLGKNVAHIDKGRDDKELMIQKKNTSTPLKKTTDRYLDVFDQLGFTAEISFRNFFEFEERSLYPLRLIVDSKNESWIGIAPFSKHNEKIYPLDKMEKVIATLSKNTPVKIFLFGSGNYEKNILDEWEIKYPQVINVAGKLNLMKELLLISYFDVMLSMDSANMHLASLVETPVVSIWGATHPSLGFYGFNQNIENAIQTDIDCRPCSVYGEIPCKRGDLACLTRITEESVISKIESFIKISPTNNEPKGVSDEVPDESKQNKPSSHNSKYHI